MYDVYCSSIRKNSVYLRFILAYICCFHAFAAVRTQLEEALCFWVVRAACASVLVS